MLDTIPAPVRNTPSRALLIPGTTVTPFVLGQYNMRVHGSDTGDMMIAIDGMRVNNLCGSGQFSGFYMNDASVQEVTYTTGAESAEMQAGGLRINSMPKDGGNTFSGTFFAYGQGSSLQADNRSDAVKPYITTAGTAYDYQINPSFGGPLKKDKLWFYFTYKYQDNKFYVPSSKFADGSPAFRNAMGNYSARGPAHLGRIEHGQDPRLRREAVQRRVLQRLQHAGDDVAGSVHRCLRQRLGAASQVDAGAVEQAADRGRSLVLQPAVRAELHGRPSGRSISPHLESTTNRLTVAAGNTIPPYTSATQDYSMMASASYVTGTHAIKAGMTDGWGTNSRTLHRRTPRSTRWSSAAARPICRRGRRQHADERRAEGEQRPRACSSRTRGRGSGSRSTTARATITSTPKSRPSRRRPGRGLQARNFPAIENVPNWDDWSVRLAGAYDLFGTGKTALKLNAGKYVASAGRRLRGQLQRDDLLTQTRAWVDLDRNGTHPRLERQHPVQRGVRRHVELRADHQPSGSGSQARLQLGVQRVGAA